MSKEIWFASMMSMVGIFEENLPHYESILRLLNIVEIGQPITRDIFLKYIFDEYRMLVEGKYVLGHVKITQPKISIFTMDPFPDGTNIYELQPHGPCSTLTCCSMDEIQSWFLSHGCPFCRSPLNLDDFKQIEVRNNLKDLETFYDTPFSKVVIKKQVIQSANQGKIIMFKGTVGSGKTSSRNEFVSQLQEKYPSVYVEVFCPDDISKTGARNGVQIIQAKLQEFIQRPGMKIGIIDTCGEQFNERDPNKLCFNISLSDFDIKIFRPNLNEDDLEGYLAFSLYNVLTRTIHSESTDFYLNHHSAGVNTCIKVHANKAHSLFGKRHSFFVNQYAKLEDILRQIEPDAQRYTASLTSVHVQVEDFIANHIQL